MGIPSYFSYIVKNHFTLLQKKSVLQVDIDHFYLDCNSIIYDVVRKMNFSEITKDETEHIINAIFYTIDGYIQTIQPRETIFIAFDGVAPMAKLNQQRERRYKSVFQNKISKNIFKDTRPDSWNTTVITPGTRFMNRLSERIHAYYNDPIKYACKKIIVSTSEEPGEGEHKLFDYIRKNPKEHFNKVTVVYGLDADLIMLCIHHLPICEKIYLFRETPEFIKSIHAELEPNEEYFLDIYGLAKCIVEHMKNNDNTETKKTKEQETLLLYDYIFLCFFLGNDFMPHFPSANIRTGGIDKILKAYKNVLGNTNETLCKGTVVQWKNVRKLVQVLAQQEEENMKQEMKLRDKREKFKLPNSTPEEKYKQFDAIPIYERALEKHIQPYKEGWQDRYYSALFSLQKENVEAKKHISLCFLEGLEWTLKYYTQGCPDWRWSYPYAYPPLFADLLCEIPYFEKELVVQKTAEPVLPLVQLCYVLPRDSLTFLTPKLYDYLMRHHSDWYSNDCEFLWAFCKYFWESHVILPEIDMKVLENIVEKKMYL